MWPPASPRSFSKKLWSGLAEILLLSDSLLGTWAHIADKSIADKASRSRLCWTAAASGTAHCSLLTAHYSSFSSKVANAG